MRKLALLLLAAAALSSCSGKDDKVIARVGPEKITESYLQEKLADISPAAQEYLSSKPGRREFLDVLIHERLMLLAARESGVTSEKAYKEKVLEKEAEMKDALKQYKDLLLTRMWIEKMRDGKLKVTDQEISGYYAAHPDEVRLEHILLPSYEEADKVYRKLKAGADFDKTAKAYSLDKDNVRLPPVMYGEFVPELEDMAFKMKVGETQGPVKTEMGFHILKKLSEDRVPQAEAAERIRRILEKKKFDDYLAKFQKKNKVEVLDEDYK